MKKSIKTQAFSEQIKDYIKKLSLSKKQARAKKKEAKAAYKNASDEISKEELKMLKSDFLQAKLIFSAEKNAWKAARKILSPYFMAVVAKEVENTEGVATTVEESGNTQVADNIVPEKPAKTQRRKKTTGKIILEKNVEEPKEAESVQV